MIPLATPCLVKWAPSCPARLGYYCTVIGHDDRGRNVVEFQDGTTGIGIDYCFLPLRPDPKLDLCNIEVVRKRDHEMRSRG